MNNAGGKKQAKLLVVLNDNKMSICPRVGGVADYLDRLRMNRFYTGLKHEVVGFLDKVPVVGDPVERFLSRIKDSIKAGLHGECTAACCSRNWAFTTSARSTAIASPSCANI